MVGRDEKAALSLFLRAQRASVLAILDGLDEDALTTPVLPSGWTPLGLVEHLGYAERHWFQEIVTGAADPLPWPDLDTPLRTSRPPRGGLRVLPRPVRALRRVLAALPLSTTRAAATPTRSARRPPTCAGSCCT